MANGLLDIGISHQYFAIDETYIEYQLGIPAILITSAKPKFFYISAGRLPSGLILNETGFISGIPRALSTFPDDDSTTYNFTVSTTDGFTVAFDDYSIIIVGPEYLSAKNDVMQVGTNIFSADNLAIRQIQWVNNSNLGTFKTSDYIYTPLEVIPTDEADVFTVVNPPPGISIDSVGILSGYVEQSEISKTYTFSVNITRKRINNINNESYVASRVFTITFVNKDYGGIRWNNLTGSGAVLEAELGFENTEGSPQKDQVSAIKIRNGGYGYVAPVSIFIIPRKGGEGAIAECSVSNGRIVSARIIATGKGYVEPPVIFVSHNAGTLYGNSPSLMTLSASPANPYAELEYKIVRGSLPPNVSLASNGAITGIPGVTTFDAVAGGPVQYISTFDSETEKFDNVFIKFDNDNPYTPTQTTFDEQTHPQLYKNTNEFFGLVTYDNSSIRFDSVVNTMDNGDDTFIGIRTFDNVYITFDSSTITMDFSNYFTTFDSKYDFAVKASDQYSSSEEYFSLNVVNSGKQYSNIKVKPLLEKYQRNMWQQFINDVTVFPPTDLYRRGDNNFGLNTGLEMLIYAGIETTFLETYVSAMQLNNKKKRFVFNTLKTTTAYDQLTKQPIYEVVYIEMTDSLVVGDKTAPISITSNGIIYNPSSILNWQKRIATMTMGERLVETDSSILPLWMRSTQTQHSNFILGIPLCYCNVGSSSSIVSKISGYIEKNNGFDFNKIDYSVDRYIIEPVLRQQGAISAIFNNYRTTI